MFQGDEHDPQGQESLVQLKEQLESREQKQVGEEQPLYSACCALSLEGLPTMWHDQMALPDLVAR